MRAGLRVFLIVSAVAVCVATPGSSAADTPRSAAEVRSQAAAWAVRQAGLHEDGTSNCSAAIDRWTRAMGLATPPCPPWCGAFVHQAYLRAGVRLSARLIDPDESYGDAIAGRHGLRRMPVADVQRGDLLFLALRPGLRASHVAIARAAPHGGVIPTVEGNVGHTVRVWQRGESYIALAARVAVP